MTRYNVHIYREMRLYFPGIEAATPDEAAAKARDLLTEDAAEIEDCNGEDLGALVDVASDEEYEHSGFIEFEAELLRKAASHMLAALKLWVSGASLDEFDQAVRSAIAQTTTSHINQPERSHDHV